MFDPIRSYDKPAVILTQLANGIATTDSVRRVLFDPAALSPRERETFVSRMKESYGGNAVADTAIDVFTNPFVWLGMLTMGTGGVAARNLATGKRFFAGGMGGHWAGQSGVANFPLLRMLGLTSGSSESIGRRLAPYAQVLSTRIGDTEQRMLKTIEPEVKRLMEAVGRKHGVALSSLDPEAAPNQAVAKDLRDILDVLYIRRAGLDKARTETIIPARAVEAERYFVRVRRDPTNPEDRKLRTVEIDREVFDALKGIFGSDNKKALSFANPQHAVVLQRIRGASNVREDIPGLGPGEPESLYATMQRLGLDKMRVRLGAKDLKVDPRRNDASADMDRAAEEAGGVRVRFEEVRRPRYVNDEESIRAVEREFGLDRFRAAEDRMYELGRVLRAGDEAEYERTGRFVLDENKILRTAAGNIKELKSAGMMDESGRLRPEGQEAVRSLLTDEVAKRLLGPSERTKGKRVRYGATEADIKRAIVESMAKGFEDPNYIPRNTVEARDAQGGRIAYNPYTGESTGRTEAGGGMFASNRTMARTRTSDVPWDPTDLQRISDRFGGTQEMRYLIEKQRQRVQGQITEQNFYRTMRVRPDVAAEKYISSTSRDYALFAHDPKTDPMVRVTMKDYVPQATQVRYPGPLGAREEGGIPATARTLEGIPPERLPPGGLSMYDLLDTELRVIGTENPADKYQVQLWRTHVIPALTGIKPATEGAQAAAAGMVRRGVEQVMNSRFFRQVEKQGGKAGRFVSDMRRWATDSTGEEFGALGPITRSLYVSHMGLNVGTVLINLMQPLQSVHQLGFKNTVKAYAQSLEMIGNYAQERARLGVGATPDQRQAAMQRAFRRTFGGQDVDITRIADISSTFEMLDKSGYGARVEVGRPKWGFLEMMMKPFQLSETLNRTVTANAVLNAYQAAGRVGGDDLVRAQMDAAQAVQQFQFGTNPINRPALFYQPVLREPAFRQFAQFGVRSVANLAAVPAMMGGTRRFAGREVTGKFGVGLVDFMRMMAVSATAYEIGKSALGVDVSRGLAMGMTDIVGGQQALTGEQPPMYVPPVVDIGWDAARMLGTGDFEILKDIAPRILPGGIALSRALGTAEPSETLQAIGLQKTYADWRQAQGGFVPVFNTDGRFMGQVPTSDVVLKAFGADLGRFSNPQEVSQFLLKNRDAIREGRRQYIAAVLGNNMSQAQRVKRDFERRFGLPLTVTQDQMKQAIKLREESVVGRTLETVDRGARDIYRQAVEEALPGQLMGAQAPGVVEQGDMYRWASQPPKAGGGQRENQS